MASVVSSDLEAPKIESSIRSRGRGSVVNADKSAVNAESVVSVVSSNCEAEVLRKLLGKVTYRGSSLSSLARSEDNEAVKCVIFSAINGAIDSAVKSEQVVKDNFEQDALKKLAMLFDCGVKFSDSDNSNFLVKASKIGAANIVKYLLDRGCPVDGPDAKKSVSPLHEAVKNFYGNTFSMISGIKAERLDYITNLHKENLIKVIRTLVENGAKIDAVGPDGKSPYSIVAELQRKHPEADPTIFDYFTMVSRSGSSAFPPKSSLPKPSPESASASPRSIKSLDSTRTPS